MSASTPPFCNTVMQQSSLTAKLPKKRQTATTSDGCAAPRFSTSTRTVMLPPCDNVRRWRVLFAIKAKVVTASSSIELSSRCFLNNSTMIGKVPSRLRIASAFSTTLSVANTSKQLRATTTLAE